VSAEENTAQVRRAVEEVWNQQGLALFDELFAAALANRGLPPGTPPTREAIQNTMCRREP